MLQDCRYTAWTKVGTTMIHTNGMWKYCQDQELRHTDWLTVRSLWKKRGLSCNLPGWYSFPLVWQFCCVEMINLSVMGFFAYHKSIHRRNLFVDNHTPKVSVKWQKPTATGPPCIRAVSWVSDSWLQFDFGFRFGFGVATVRLNSRDCQHAPIPPNSIFHVSKWLTQVSITHLALKQDRRVGYHPNGALLGFRVTFSFIYHAGC